MEWEWGGDRDRSNFPVVVKEKLNKLVMLSMLLSCGGVKRELGSIADFDDVEGTLTS
jgi:hypothetical protein